MRIVDLTIEDIAFGGKGVARENGKAVFIPFTIDGEKISARIVREKKQFAQAEIVDLRESSPHRVEAPCPYFRRCGGCAYQHIDYEHQLAIKWRQARDVLQRIGKLKDIPMRPIVASPTAYAYRNRITVHAQDGLVGFFRRDSHRLIDIERCPIAMDEVNGELTKLRAQHPRENHYTLRATSGPRIFSQTNDAVANALRDIVLNVVPSNQHLLVDAYCGAGFFAKAMLEKFERIIGIDWDKFAIGVASRNATSKETYIAGDIEEQLLRALEEGRAAQTTLLVDPPATGLSESIRKTIVDLTPARVIYISCNPSTLARDLRELTRKYMVKSVTPLDMFPQTAEIEVAVHLQAASAELPR
jgi:23S rRNA (uracil1939-C5)-methyltransferase